MRSSREAPKSLSRLISAIEARSSLEKLSEARIERLIGLIGGAARFKEVARTMDISERQLHRRCLDALGMPPSILRRILRLHRAAHISGARSSGRTRSWADLALEAGFADQSHLARETRALTLATARSAFGVRSVQDGAAAGS